MIDYESAFCCLTHMIEFGKYPPTFYKRDLESAIEALEKQLPKQAVLETACWEVCPSCHAHYIGYKHCTNCGQKIQ